jgi:phosphoenolpyruvate-protein kinase (PTS system EI component)
LCSRVGARLAGRAPARLPPGTLLVSGRVTVCDALELACAHGVGIVLASRAEDSSGIDAAVALGLPVLSGVDELFRWVADGDRALLDTAERTLLINPSRVDVLSHRRTAKT